MLNIDVLNGNRPRFLNYGSAGEGANVDCYGTVIPGVDDTALPCDGLIITTDCITSSKAYNFFGIGIGEYLSSVFTKITDKVRGISNQVAINTKAIADEIARATLTESNLNFAIGVEETSRINADALKANIASPTLTGIPNAPTAFPGTNTIQIATTAFVTAADALKANIASPTLTGIPAAPTAAPGTNTTQIATTGFVTNAISSLGGVATTKVSISSFLIQNLGSISAQLLPAPGVGKTYDILSIMLKTNFNTIPFNATPDTLAIYYSTASVGIYSALGLINQNGNHIQYLDKVIANSGDDQIMTNDSLRISAGSDPSAGNGTIDIYITYKIITL